MCSHTHSRPALLAGSGQASGLLAGRQQTKPCVHVCVSSLQPPIGTKPAWIFSSNASTAIPIELLSGNLRMRVKGFLTCTYDLLYVRNLKMN